MLTEDSSFTYNIPYFAHPGRTENYNQFIITRTFINKNLFILRKFLRKVHYSSVQLFGDQICDFSLHRKSGENFIFSTSFTQILHFEKINSKFCFINDHLTLFALKFRKKTCDEPFGAHRD